ncbi:MAG: DNA polymerase III subunit beta [Pseudomonadota bacterium]
MKLSIQKEDLLRPLQQTVGAIERRQTLPVLAHFLLSAKNNQIAITATDLEIELFAQTAAHIEQEGDVTVPARKLVDICRSLPDGAEIDMSATNEKVILVSGKSRFTLSTLPVSEFPTLDDIGVANTFAINQSQLLRAINKTAFSMAQQDVRYYLNGLLFEVTPDMLRCVATDGHRLSLSTVDVQTGVETASQVIVPRKGVNELSRLLDTSDEPAEFQLTANHIRINMPEVRFTSKLIDGKFPDYGRVLPEGNDKTVIADRESLKQSLSRAAILSNEKYKGVRLQISDNTLNVRTHNPDHEEAEDELAIEYTGEAIEVGFNVVYLLDILNTLEGTSVKIRLKDANSSCLATEIESADCKYVVMPMRL